MPRALKTQPNALRRLRNITGLSQQAFAILAGLSVETIKDRESRGKALSRNSARRIANVTGASIDSICGNGPLRTHLGFRYNESVWAAWKAATSFSPTSVRKEAELMGKRIIALVCAADVDQRFLPTLTAIKELINNVLSTRKSRTAYVECLKAVTTERRILRHRVGDLRRNIAYAKKVGFRDSKRLSDVALVEVIEERYVLECSLPAEKIECAEEGTHYAFDWYGLRRVYQGRIDGKRPWTSQVEPFITYLHAPVAPPSLTRPSGSRRRRKA